MKTFLRDYAINNAYVSRCTRNWLYDLAENGDVLDEPSRVLIQQVLDHLRTPHNPSGMIYSILRGFKRSDSLALEVSGVTELFYACASFLDDIQDGHSDYLIADEGIKVNVVMQLAYLSWLRTKGSFRQERMLNTALKGLIGQRQTLIGTVPTNIDEYVYLSKCIAGNVFKFYFSVDDFYVFSPHAGRLPYLGYCLGCWLQIRNDIDSQDPRIEKIKRRELVDWQKSLEIKINAQIAIIGDPVWGIHEMVFPNYGTTM